MLIINKEKMFGNLHIVLNKLLIKYILKNNLLNIDSFIKNIKI